MKVARIVSPVGQSLARRPDDGAHGVTRPTRTDFADYLQIMKTSFFIRFPKIACYTGFCY
jgi:hypothetical protein